MASLVGVILLVVGSGARHWRAELFFDGLLATAARWPWGSETTTDGRVLKLLHVVDEHTREALAVEVEQRIDADQTVAVLERIVAVRARSPELVRMDNGPELTANALRDWCRLSGSRAAYIEPGSPWQNPFVESFGSRVRDELLAVEAFDQLLEVSILDSGTPR